MRNQVGPSDNRDSLNVLRCELRLALQTQPAAIG
jgi:hypothetical protein